MLVARGRRVRPCDLDDEVNDPGCLVTADALDQCEFAVVLHDGGLVYGVVAIPVSKTLTSAAVTQASGKCAAAHHDSALSRIVLLQFLYAATLSFHHALLVLTETLERSHLAAVMSRGECGHA